MTKAAFKSYNQGQIILFPASLDEKIPQSSPVRLINQIVDNMDITKVFDTYKGGGTSAYHPRMMLKVVLFSYLNNIYSCRKIDKLLWIESVSCGCQAIKHSIIIPLIAFVPLI